MFRTNKQTSQLLSKNQKNDPQADSKCQRHGTCLLSLPRTPLSLAFCLSCAASCEKSACIFRCLLGILTAEKEKGVRERGMSKSEPNDRAYTLKPRMFKHKLLSTPEGTQ